MTAEDPAPLVDERLTLAALGLPPLADDDDLGDDDAQGAVRPGL